MGLKEQRHDDIESNNSSNSITRALTKRLVSVLVELIGLTVPIDLIDRIDPVGPSEDCIRIL